MKVWHRASVPPWSPHHLSRSLQLPPQLAEAAIDAHQEDHVQHEHWKLPNGGRGAVVRRLARDIVDQAGGEVRDAQRHGRDGGAARQRGMHDAEAQRYGEQQAP